MQFGHQPHSIPALRAKRLTIFRSFPLGRPVLVGTIRFCFGCVSFHSFQFLEKIQGDRDVTFFVVLYRESELWLAPNAVDRLVPADIREFSKLDFLISQP